MEQGRRSSRLRRGRFVVLAMVLPFLAISSAEAAECPAGEACVVVTLTGTTESTQVVTIAQIQEWNDLESPLYFTRTRPGGDPTPGPRPVQALSIRTLLSKLTEPLPPDSVTFSEVPNRADIPSVLAPGDFDEPNADDYPFEGELMPAIYVTDAGDAIGYVRPLRDDKDLTKADQFETEPLGRLDLTFHTTGKLLAPVVKVADNDVTTKDTNDFTVGFASKPGTTLAYSWTFGDGSDEVKRPAPSHRYTKRGTYSVVVSVRGGDGSYGRSAAVRMKVDKPPKAPSDGGGSNGGNTPAPSIPYDDAPYFGNEPDFIPDEPSTEDAGGEDILADDGLEAVEGFVLAGAGAETGDDIPGTTPTSQATPLGELSTQRKIAGWALGGLAVALLMGLGAAGETRWIRARLSTLGRRT